MEKLNFFKQLLDTWVNLEDKKKVSYITGIVIVILCLVIYGGFIHYENKLTEAENEKTRIRNEHTIVVNGIISRYNGLLDHERQEKEECEDNFVRYLEKNEKETRDLLFNSEKLEKKLNKE